MCATDESVVQLNIKFEFNNKYSIIELLLSGAEYLPFIYYSQTFLMIIYEAVHNFLGILDRLNVTTNFTVTNYIYIYICRCD